MSLQPTPPFDAALFHTAETDDQNNEADLVVQRVRESADYKYRETKKRKQEELAHRIAEVQRTGDRNRLRNEKKRVDNHASAVASRYKQEFLVGAFDNLVRAKMRESAELAKALRDKEVCLARKDVQIRALSRRVLELMSEVEMLSARCTMLAESRQVAGVVERGGWLEDTEFGVEGENRVIQGGFNGGDLDGSGVGDGVETGVGAGGRGSMESTLTTLLRAVGNHGGNMNAELYKVEGAPWEPLQSEMVSERQNLVRSQFRVDKSDSVFDPAA